MKTERLFKKRLTSISRNNLTEHVKFVLHFSREFVLHFPLQGVPCLKGNNRTSRIQCRLNVLENEKFEEIRQVILFEKQAGNHVTPHHVYAADDKVTDADVIRYLIKNFKFND